MTRRPSGNPPTVPQATTGAYNARMELRAQLIRTLAWDEAHVNFDKAVENLPVDRQGATPEGFEHSPWQLLEHMRLAQADLLDFCVNAQYVHALAWPDDYWPKSPAPPDGTAWQASVARFRADRQRLQQLAADASLNLFAPVPTGKAEQTYLRALLLVIDHNSYHLGQIVAARRALGVWP